MPKLTELTETLNTNLTADKAESYQQKAKYRK